MCYELLSEEEEEERRKGVFKINYNTFYLNILAVNITSWNKLWSPSSISPTNLID